MAEPLPTTPHPVLVRWPEDAARRWAAAASGAACVLLVGRGTPPPVLGAREDWAYRDADERDVAARIAAARTGSPTDPDAAVVERSIDDRAVGRLLGLLTARPGHLVRWVDVGPSALGRRALADAARALLDEREWWIEEVAGAGIVAGPVGVGS